MADDTAGCEVRLGPRLGGFRLLVTFAEKGSIASEHVFIVPRRHGLGESQLLSAAPAPLDPTREAPQ